MPTACESGAAQLQRPRGLADLARQRPPAESERPVENRSEDTVAADDLLSKTSRLCNLVGKAQHVKVLQEADLIVRAKSEGDRRRTYLTSQPGICGRNANDAGASPPPRQPDPNTSTFLVTALSTVPVHASADG
ncbi:hypothetical protein Asi03nite_44360 [Actinoplanes siamensis]|uniref:Uncharacterized protein n=1 Tax=Actinoplanes siamensis TaxID=1223317 RepID=A0A919N9B7_9ACTN|nr:hypothetical protein Asi03nite_44360 [Actinoplanes siamensis]